MSRGVCCVVFCDIYRNVDVVVLDPGLHLEGGVYISKISPGSALAKEGNIAVGDRVLSVNDKPVEHRSAKVYHSVT